MLRLTLFLFALAGLFLATPVNNAYSFVYMDKNGIHYANSPPNNITRRNEFKIGDLGKPKPKPKPKPKGHQVGWPKPHGQHKPINYHGHNYPYDPVLQKIIEKEAEAFCSTFLHIVPYAATTTKVSTKTTSSVEATDTITSTSISSPGATTVTATASTTTTTSDVVATTTLTDVITTTTTSTTTSTTTTFQFTAPNGLERRGGGGNDGGKGGGGGCEIPPWLPFPSSAVSSACNKIVTRKTEILSATTTSTVPLTTTTTTTTTTTLPQITDTVTSTATTTDVVPITASTTTFTTTATTTTTTANAVATQCATFANVDGGGVDTSGTLTPFTNLQSAEACCEFCWTGTGCGLWFFFPGFGCFIVADASGPDPTTQCPTGDGDYVVINASGFDGNQGGAGPCAGSLVD